MRITKWMIAVALAVLLFSARPLAADGAATVFDVVILHGRVMDRRQTWMRCAMSEFRAEGFERFQKRSCAGKKRSNRADWSSRRDPLISMSTDRSRASISS